MRGSLRVLLGLVTCGGLSIAPLGASAAIHAAPAAGKAAGVRAALSPKASRHMRVRIVGTTPSTRESGIRTHAQITNGQTQVFFAPSDLAARLGIDVATLQQDLQAGQTVLQIAGSRYGSAVDLATALLAPFKEKMDRIVAAGALSADQASGQYAAMLSSVEAMVVTSHPQLASAADATGADAAQGKGSGDQQPPSELRAAKQAAANAIAASCNTTADALYSALQSSGQTPLAVCQRTNTAATVDSISAAIVTALTTQLNADVAAGKTTAVQAAQVLNDIEEHIAYWLTTPYGAGKS